MNVWRKCGHPRTAESTMAGGRHGGGQCRACHRKVKARYDASEKGREAHRRYEASEKGQARRDKWNAEWNVGWNASEKKERWTNSPRGQLSNMLHEVKRNANRRANA